MIISRKPTRILRQSLGISKLKNWLFSGFKKWEIFSLSVCLVSMVISGIIAIKYFPPGTSNVVIHYNIPFGIDMIGYWWVIWLLPLIAFFFFLINTLVFLPWFRNSTIKGLILVHYANLIISLGILWLVWLLQFQQILS
ncbi:MAG: hypothetical protein WCT08_01715 [Patescibacteria group bacterium]|jgi:hypothetical protein